MIEPGHSCMLQDSVIFDRPVHSCPPNAAFLAGTLVFNLIPPPQSLEHSDTSQSSHTQSTRDIFINFVH